MICVEYLMFSTYHNLMDISRNIHCLLSLIYGWKSYEDESYPNKFPKSHSRNIFKTRSA